MTAKVFPIVCFLWQGHGHIRNDVPTYRAHHVNGLLRMLRRTLSVPFQLVCATDQPQGIDPAVRIVTLPMDVRHLPSYLPKLWAFSREFGAVIGQRFVVTDLDVVLVGDLAPRLTPGESFIIESWARGEPYSSSFFTLDPGARAEVWQRLSAENIDRARDHFRTHGLHWCGDQSFIAWVLGDKQPTFRDGLTDHFQDRLYWNAPKPGIAAYYFNGPRDPATHKCEWVRDAYYAEAHEAA